MHQQSNAFGWVAKIWLVKIMTNELHFIWVSLFVLLLPVSSRILPVNKKILASSEGHLEVVRFLVETACVKISVKDRWGATPIDNAKQFKQQEIIDYLNKLNLNDSPRIPGIGL